MIERMDHAVVAVASTEDAATPYERLGLKLSPPARHDGIGSESRTFFVGTDARQSFYVELFGIFDEARARAAGREVYLDAIARGGGLTRIMFKVEGLAELVDQLRANGVQTAVEEIVMAGQKSSDIAILGAVPAMSIDAGLFQSVLTTGEAYARRKAAGRYEHDFPLKRVDHLAAITSDIEGSCRFWSEALGVPVFGEVRGATMLIRQLKMGDSILELIEVRGGATRPAGLISMVAWEVADLDDALGLARERGFTHSEPAAGVLPGTRVATIPAGELSGLAMQLLEYV